MAKKRKLRPFYKNFRESQLAKKEKEWEIEKNFLERENKIKEEKKALKNSRRKLSMSKIMLIVLFINCFVLQVFTGWVTILSIQSAAAIGMTADLSPLTALIGSVITEVLALCGYFIKSTKENTKGGIIYDQAITQEQSGDIIPGGDIGGDITDE